MGVCVSEYFHELFGLVKCLLEKFPAGRESTLVLEDVVPLDENPPLPLQPQGPPAPALPFPIVTEARKEGFTKFVKKQCQFFPVAAQERRAPSPYPAQRAPTPSAASFVDDDTPPASPFIRNLKHNYSIPHLQNVNFVSFIMCLTN